MQRKFTVTSVSKIYSKMYELSMHADYDHFIPSTSKQGKLQLQTNIFSRNSNPFSIKLHSYVGWQVEISVKKT